MPDHLDREPYGEPVGVSSHWCEPWGGRVYCEADECPRCDDA